MKYLVLFLLPFFFVSPQSDASSNNELRLISYNAWGLPRPFLIKAKRFKQIAASIGQFDADVIGFQETFTKYAKVLGEMEEYPYRAWGSPKIKKKKMLNSGLLTVSRYPIVKSEYLVFSKCSGTDCFAAKGALWTLIDVPGVGLVNVFNTHTNAGKSKRVKRSQMSEIKKFIEERLEGRSSVFLGDMNFQPDEETYHYVKYIMDFEDSLDLYLQDNPQYYNDPNVIYTYRWGKKAFARRLDYFWLKDIGPRPMSVKEYQVIFDNKKGKKLSDHLGIMLDLQFD